MDHFPDHGFNPGSWIMELDHGSFIMDQKSDHISWILDHGSYHFLILRSLDHAMCSDQNHGSKK